MAALTAQPCLLLADDMGLGKTVQAIMALTHLIRLGEVRTALVVAPVGLLVQWRAELWRWAPSLPVICVQGNASERRWQWQAAKQLYLCSYDVVRNDASARERLWDLVVLDEAQRIKNRDSALSRACKRLRRTRSWAMTGTPLENREDELASVLEFVRPNPEGVPMSSLGYGPGLRARHAELQLRRRKCDVLHDLPPKWTCPVILDLEPAQRLQYKQVQAQGRESLERLGPSATTVNVLEVISQLKQICNFCPVTGGSAKLVDLKQRLQILCDEGHRALVFSQWTNDRFGVARLCRELAEFQPLAYTGALSAQERGDLVARFQQSDSRHKVMVLSLKAGGQGLNLQQASYVIHFDRWWNPAVENQATDRSHRMGQTRGVTVYSYTCQDTIEERIEQILDGKRRLFQLLVDEVSLDARQFLNQGELFGLLGLPAPPRQGKRPTAAATFPERLASLFAQAGWTCSPEGRACHDDGRVLQLECRQHLPIEPAVGPRLILVTEHLDAQQLATSADNPDTTIWGITELESAERALSYSPK